MAWNSVPFCRFGWPFIPRSTICISAIHHPTENTVVFSAATFLINLRSSSTFDSRHSTLIYCTFDCHLVLVYPERRSSILAIFSLLFTCSSFPIAFGVILQFLRSPARHFFDSGTSLLYNLSFSNRLASLYPPSWFSKTQLSITFFAFLLQYGMSSRNLRPISSVCLFPPDSQNISERYNVTKDPRKKNELRFR